MELWIRSQDKEKLLKVNGIQYQNCKLVENEIIEGNILIGFHNSYDNEILGEYKTEERALEVLEKIQKLIKPTFKINYEYDNSQPIINGEWLKSLKAESKIEELSCYVYEMPKE